MKITTKKFFVISFFSIFLIVIIGYYYLQQQEMQKSFNQRNDITTPAYPYDRCRLFSSSYSNLNPRETLECEKQLSVSKNNDGSSLYSYYPETIELKGFYIKKLRTPTEYEPFSDTDTVYFIPDEDQRYKLPKSEHVPKDSQINFRDHGGAELLFQTENQIPKKGDICEIKGSAVIRISEVTINNSDAGIPLSLRVSVQLDSVIQKEPYTRTCEKEN